MRDPKNLTIALLCVSATLLATVLVLLGAAGQPAYADTPVRGGDYIMITGAYSDSTDLLYVLDVATQRINTYVFNPQNNDLILRHQFNLTPVFR